MSSETYLVGSAQKIVASADALRSRPITSLSVLFLAGEVPEMAELAAMPELARITELTLQGSRPSWQNIPPPAKALGALARCRHLGALRKLELETNLLDDAGAAALAQAPFLASIEELLIMDSPAISDGGLAPLFRSLSALRRLYVRETRIGPESARALANVGVRELHLEKCALHEAGAMALFESSALVGTERLVIDHDFLRDAIGPLARSQHVRGLQSLELKHCSLLDADGVTLAAALALQGLTFLDLSHNLLGDEAAVALASSTSFPRVQKLDLRGNDIKIKGASALGAPTGLPALELLGLSDNQLLSGNTHVYEWGGGMWEAGSVVVEEKLGAREIEERTVCRPRIRVF